MQMISSNQQSSRDAQTHVSVSDDEMSLARYDDNYSL